VRAVALLSGGLDSTLAIRLMLDQGIEVAALNCVSVFCTCTPKSFGCSAARVAVRQLGVELKTISTSAELLDVVKKPKHGYGKNLNPCLDCRIVTFRKAREYMREVGASFLVTGEVLGERPMSQRREAMKLIEAEAGVAGLVVRPLSAALLEPTIPERNGWIDRARLLGIQGRSRKPQIELARQYGIADYPCPAGGCRLTDRGFAERMRDLMAHTRDFSLDDVKLLKLGRHFRLSPTAKVVIGRDKEENKELVALAGDDDMLLEVVGFSGPVALVRGAPSHDELLRVAAVTAGYGKARNEGQVQVRVWGTNGGATAQVLVAPADAGILEKASAEAPRRRECQAK